MNGLKLASIDGLSEGAIGFRLPKNIDGLGARDTDCVIAPETGLEVALGSVVGLKELAAGFGLNSMALTLNLADVAEVGLRTSLGFWGLGVSPI